MKLLTGIKPTGAVHLGNFIGAIDPIKQKSLENYSDEFYVFIADGHSLTPHPNKKELLENSKRVSAAWVSCGINLENTYLYRQSQIPQIFQLAWILSCYCSKGLLNRNHSYKSIVDENIDAGYDKDYKINAGIFTYPVLMSADILTFDIDFVPIGEDQNQHLEISRDIAERINSNYKHKLFKLPEYQSMSQRSILGLDGRKMSKSYNNIIPLFCSKKKLRKCIFSIPTNSKDKGEPKYPYESDVIELFHHFSTRQQYNELVNDMEKGLSWRDVKERTFQNINSVVALFRETFNEHEKNDFKKIQEILEENERKIREKASEKIEFVKDKIGFNWN